MKNQENKRRPPVEQPSDNESDHPNNKKLQEQRKRPLEHVIRRDNMEKATQGKNLRRKDEHPRD